MPRYRAASGLLYCFRTFNNSFFFFFFDSLSSPSTPWKWPHAYWRATKKRNFWSKSSRISRHAERKTTNSKADEIIVHDTKVESEQPTTKSTGARALKDKGALYFGYKTYPLLIPGCTYSGHKYVLIVFFSNFLKIISWTHTIFVFCLLNDFNGFLTNKNIEYTVKMFANSIVKS